MNSTAVIRECKKATAMHGIFTRIARDLSLSVNHVREVAIGNRKSQRVMRALQAELRKIERAA